MTRTLLLDANMPYHLWIYAALTLVYLINRLPSPTTHKLSPFELLYNKKPNYNFLKVFGCLCCPLLPPHQHHKLEPKAHQSVFLGYAQASKGYICLNLATGQICTSIHEHIFPFHTSSSHSPPISLLFQPHIHLPLLLSLQSAITSTYHPPLIQILYPLLK